MAQNLPALVFVSVIVLIGAILRVIPTEELLPLLLYFVILIPAGVLLFNIGIKPIDAQFPPLLYWLAFVVKLIGGVARYWIVAEVYEFRADAPEYHVQGQFVAQFYRAFDFSVLDWYSFRGGGTTNLVHVTALFYTILPPSLSAMFFLFTGLAFVGSVMFYAAFRVAFPDRDPTFYRVVVFFLPSLLFWPSSLGKEAWILFNLGFVAYGIALYLRRGKILAIVPAVFGLLMIFFIRPHVASVVGVAIGAAYFLFLLSKRGMKNPFTWLLAAGIIVGLVAYVIPSAQSYVGVSELTLEDLESSYQLYQGRTSGGNSGFDTYNILTPHGLIMGVITVLFRPFPWETRNPQMVATALEAFILLILAWLRWGIFWQRIRAFRKDAWIAFLLLSSLLMILTLTTFGNFGILARQRSLLMPFFWMLFA